MATKDGRFLFRESPTPIRHPYKKNTWLGQIQPILGQKTSSFWGLEDEAVLRAVSREAESGGDAWDTDQDTTFPWVNLDSSTSNELEIQGMYMVFKPMVFS